MTVTDSDWIALELTRLDYEKYKAADIIAGLKAERDELLADWDQASAQLEEERRLRSVAEEQRDELKADLDQADARIAELIAERNTAFDAAQTLYKENQALKHENQKLKATNVALDRELNGS